MVKVTNITNTGTNMSYVTIMQGGERYLSPHLSWEEVRRQYLYFGNQATVA